MTHPKIAFILLFWLFSQQVFAVATEFMVDNHCKDMVDCMTQSSAHEGHVMPMSDEASTSLFACDHCTTACQASLVGFVAVPERIISRPVFEIFLILSRYSAPSTPRYHPPIIA
jgi:hypothetical protein